MAWGEPPPGEPVLEANDSPGHPLAPWFAFWREQRRARYADRGAVPPRRSAVLTIVHNEPLFLPVWLRYYSRFFAPEDIYVLDHDTTDGSTDGDGFVRIPVSHPEVDMTWIVATVEAHQHELIERYDVVVVVDVDEIVAPDPSHGDLGDYLARFDEEWVNCLGYEVLHMPGERPFDAGRPVLEQRSTWFPSVAYDKPSIASAPIRWQPGFHRRADNHFAPDPDLRLIHLHRLDYDVCKARHRGWSSRPWNEADLREGWTTHNRVTDDAEFDRWFYTEVAGEGFELRPEPIPAAWRSVV